MFFCVTQFKNDTIFESQRQPGVPANESRTGWDVMWRDNGTATIDIFENERDIIFVNGKTARNTQIKEGEEKE